MSSDGSRPSSRSSSQQLRPAARLHRPLDTHPRRRSKSVKQHIFKHILHILLMCANAMCLAALLAAASRSTLFSDMPNAERK